MKTKLPKKDTMTTIYIRNVPSTVKKRFTAEAKKLGYKPRELFQLLVLNKVK